MKIYTSTFPDKSVFASSREGPGGDEEAGQGREETHSFCLPVFSDCKVLVKALLPGQQWLVPLMSFSYRPTASPS